MQNSTTAKDNDVTVNKYALSVADFAKTAQSWLNADAAGNQPGSGVNAVEDDDEFPEFEPEPSSDLTGVGYVTPSGSTGDFISMESRQTSAATEKLRRKMLGKRARPLVSVRSNATTGRGNAGGMASKRALKGLQRTSDDSEENGRSHIGGNGRQSSSRTSTQQSEAANSENDLTAISITSSLTKQPPSATAKKRGGSYLDEILAERAHKKKKKKRRAEG